MQDTKACMETVKLKLNKAKTELIYFWSRQQLNKTTYTTIYFIGESIKTSTKVRYLGGHLDSSLTFKDHIQVYKGVAGYNICIMHIHVLLITLGKFVTQI